MSKVKTLNRFLSLALCLCLVMTLLPAVTPAARAAEDSWDGTADTSWASNYNSVNSFTITTAEQLAQLSVLVGSGKSFSGKTITLANDLDLSGHNWTPIGDSELRFHGTFDGGGHVIRNMTVNVAGLAGLFAHISLGASIKHLGLEGGSVTAGGGNLNYAGGLVGFSEGAAITGCYNTGSVTASGGSTNSAGGLVGHSLNTAIAGCYSTGSVAANGGSSNDAGGLVGYCSTSSTVNACYWNADTGLPGVGSGTGSVTNSVGKTLAFMISQAFANQLNADIGTHSISLGGYCWIWNGTGKTPELLAADCVATVDDVTVSGAQGAPLTAQTATITLGRTTLASELSGDDVSSWVTNLPDGISVTASGAASGNTITLTFGGTPTAAFSEVMSITIPAGVLTGGAELAVTANADAKFSIVSPTLSATVADVTVSGIIGTTLSTQTATITLTNVTVKSGELTDVGANVNSWFNTNNLPADVEVIATGLGDTITLTFSGTPTEASSAAFDITIPASVLTGGAELAVTANADAKFNILGSIPAAAVAGIASPVNGDTPVTTVTGTNYYTGTVSWSPTVSGTFNSSTVYTATVTLTAKSGYAFVGGDTAAISGFTVNGIAPIFVSNSYTELKFTVAFPKTAPTVTQGNVVIDLTKELTNTDAYTVTGSAPAYITLNNPARSYTITGTAPDNKYAVVVGDGSQQGTGVYNIELVGAYIAVGAEITWAIINAIDILPGVTANINFSGTNTLSTKTGSSSHGSYGSAIHVPVGASLWLDGGEAEGDTLTVAASMSAAIGGNCGGESAGSIHIAGGKLNVTSPHTAIGGGYGIIKDPGSTDFQWGQHSNGGDSGAILISGGDVTVHCGSNSCGGIGGGDASYDSSSGQYYSYGSTDLTVTGGKLTVYGYTGMRDDFENPYPFDVPLGSGNPIRADTGSIRLLGGEVSLFAGLYAPAIALGAGAELFVGKNAKLTAVGGMGSGLGGFTNFLVGGGAAAIGAAGNDDFAGKVIIEAGADVTLTGGAGVPDGGYLKYLQNDLTQTPLFTGGSAAIGGRARVETTNYSGDAAPTGIADTAVIILPDGLAGLTLIAGAGFVHNSIKCSGDGAAIGTGGRGPAFGHAGIGNYDADAMDGTEAAFAAKPTVSLAGDSFSEPQTVTLSCATANAIILYTVDGSDPKVSSTAKTAADGDTVDIGWGSTTLRAFAYKGGMVSSDTLRETYIINTPNVPGGGTTPETIPAVDGEVAVDYTQSGETVTLDLPASKVEEIIEAAEGGTASFDISGVEDAGEAVIPASALKTLAEAGLEVEIKLPEGMVTLDGGALATAVASGGNVTVSLNEVKAETLTAAQRAQLRPGDVVFDISLMAGTKVIHELSGTVTVTVPYDGALPVAVWYLNDAGKLEKLACSYHNGFVTFTTDHLSLYVLGQDTAWQNPFTDVAESAWYFNAVRYVYENGVMNGTGGSLFAPGTNLSRAMMVQILYNIEGKPASGSVSFDDVSGTAWYADAVAWAAENNIVKGIGQGLFAPDAPVTREQMAVMLYNYCVFKGIELPLLREGGAFADADKISLWAVEATEKMYQAQVLNGKGDNLFDPQGTATRAEVATMLYNFLEAMK